jgi:1-acyl-sn-glycerol-3-phosphate acyltransferase
MGRSIRFVSPVYLLAAAISWPFVKVGFRLRARGTDNLPQGGFVLAANHTSNFDPWALGIPLFPRRQLRFMAKS